MRRARLQFGIAETAADFEQIFRLNHDTFTREIPQHAGSADGRLVDRFHEQNTYVICRNGDEVIGMVALRAQRPFSLDAKLPDLDRYLPAGRAVCELRLLAVKPGYRRSAVLPGLIRELVRVGRARRLDYAVISGTTRQLKLYTHLGFEPFGPRVGSAEAQFQPMRLAIERFTSKVAWLDDTSAGAPHAPLSLHPGLADVSPAVRAAAAHAPLPHRSEDVAHTMHACRAALTRLGGADEVQILLGSGTLANDAVAAQLHSEGGRVAVLVNGEFGERLADQARRARLEHFVHAVPWGSGFDYDALGAALAVPRPPRWIWMVHCETSTGVLNDLARLKALAGRLGARIALDCVSSIGNLALDLRGVAYASGVSGKGLAALPGLAFVFHARGAPLGGGDVPRYLDLSLYAANSSVPFTHSSNLLAALGAALAETGSGRIAHIAATGAAVRAALAQRDFAVVGDPQAAAPFVATLALPRRIDSHALAGAMRERGWHIAHESRYLAERNWVQLAWMGNVGRGAALQAVAALAECRAALGDAAARRAACAA